MAGIGAQMQAGVMLGQNMMMNQSLPMDPSQSSNSLEQKMLQLKQLKEKELISLEEYEAKKQSLLATL